MRKRDMRKQKAMDLALESGGIASDEERKAWAEYKIYRNRVNNRKGYDELIYKQQKFEDCKDSPDQTWKCAKNFMKWKSTGSPTQIEVEGKLVTKAADIAMHMNNFFVNKVKMLRSSMQTVAWHLTTCMQIMVGKTCKLGLTHVSTRKVNTLI